MAMKEHMPYKADTTTTTTTPRLLDDDDDDDGGGGDSSTTMTTTKKNKKKCLYLPYIHSYTYKPALKLKESKSKCSFSRQV